MGDSIFVCKLPLLVLLYLLLLLLLLLLPRSCLTHHVILFEGALAAADPRWLAWLSNTAALMVHWTVAKTAMLTLEMPLANWRRC